jgi:hypothetical protein
MENSTEYSKNDASDLEWKKLVASWIQQYDIDGIISDNRLGVLTKCTVCVHNAST